MSTRLHLAITAAFLRVLALPAFARQQPGRSQRGGGGDRFEGQPRINALIVSGG